MKTKRKDNKKFGGHGKFRWKILYFFIIKELMNDQYTRRSHQSTKLVVSNWGKRETSESKVWKLTKCVQYISLSYLSYEYICKVTLVYLLKLIELFCQKMFDTLIDIHLHECEIHVNKKIQKNVFPLPYRECNVREGVKSF